MGINNYPSDITSAYSLLVNYKTPSNARVRNTDHNNNGAANNNGTTTTNTTSNQTPAAEASAMTFTQDGANASTVEGASDNRNNLAANTGTTLLQHALMLAQVKPHSIDPDWILLDSQSTISVFNNPTMLSNIRKSEHVLRAMTNGGYQDSHMVGDFANLGTVWFNSESIANILSLADVTKVCRVTMDSGKEASISVHRKDRSVMKFVEHPSGLYVFDSKSKALGDTTTAYTMVTTVAQQPLAYNEGQPLIQASGLVVEWNVDQTIDDDAYDLDYDPPDDDPDDDVVPEDFDPVERDELRDLAADQGQIEEPGIESVQGTPATTPNNQEIEQELDETWEEENDATFDIDTDNEIDNNVEMNQALGHEEGENQGADPEDENTTLNQGARDNEDAANVEQNQDDTDVQGANVQNVYNLRERRGNTNAFRNALDNPYNSKSYFPPTQLHQLAVPIDMQKRVFAFVFTQMSARAGLKKYGQRAVAAMTTEFAQFEDLDVYEVVDPKTLTVEEKRAALRALNLLQEKRCGKLKGRTVADGRKQRSMYEKSETASPTVANDALMLSIMIDAHERRDIATSDVVGAYLKCKMDDYVLIRFEGESVDILCQMNPSHRQFVTIENGKKVLYARLNKAMYGCVKSALLWYNLLSSSLKEMGFEINPYDPCVANSTINGKQCTIVWYVDDMKISHADPAVVTSVIEKLEAKFGKMKTTRGKEHTFLGMKIKYTDEGTAAITMIDYLQEAIVESGLDVTKTAVTPARKELLKWTNLPGPSEG
ncbi:Reverse transcriptase (RNA-dependent DNA polymerase) [Fragilaria crotonensis]|nr:Reverse transcriptase (RNA-dependent DNA polymerase) [Fragilaria crotonensis]